MYIPYIPFYIECISLTYLTYSITSGARLPLFIFPTSMQSMVFQ